MNNQGLTLLSAGQIWGNDNESQLDVMKRYGDKACVTDLCILTGSEIGNKRRDKTYYNIDEDRSLTGRTGKFWTKSVDDFCPRVTMVDESGGMSVNYRDQWAICSGVVRPVLQSSVIFSQISPNRVRGFNGTEEVEYGEYPQYAADKRMQKKLEEKYAKMNKSETNKTGMNKTGKIYTFNSVSASQFFDDSGKPLDLSDGVPEFKAVPYEEYEYQEKKYIRVRANGMYVKLLLSNSVEYRNNDYVWVEVSPVKWLIDDKTETLVSKKGLVSGIRFYDIGQRDYNGDFEKTEMKEYLDRYMLKELLPTFEFSNTADVTSEKKEEKPSSEEKNPSEQKRQEIERKPLEKRRNPYGLKLDTVSEEEIIKGAIESGVAVFLHGPSSEGKSARVKQIDPTCEIIYLRNATPDSLNGKSVYNQATGEMIDIPPTWLKKLQEKCEKEPDRYHIVFFDEITNALPSIQGIAFNIVLDREVNGIWKLPDNARIVAAGNDMKDSLAANKLAEPLFNRFAHVYIKTTTESWLKWASENNIHPAIYSYIAYKNGETLRSKYDGEKPNADPRKWEMASKMLYATGSPEMLRALVGEDITREFVEFCNQPVITIDDVINENYTDRDVQVLNTAERFATTMGLSQVGDDNLEKVRNFVSGLGEEFGAIFDVLWTHGDESKLDRLAEAKLAERHEGGIRR